MKYPLNQQQTKAVAEFNTDLLVTAGAGTGKTSVLTSKYLRLLEERRAGIEEIVAITFTNKAAAEMRSRIQQEIQQHVNEAEVSPEIAFWKSQLQKIENARINTFHSFCLGLLHEHPLEVGISPVTSILGEGEETIYLNQAIEGVLVESFHDPHLDPKELTQVVLNFGWESLIADLGDIYQRIRESGKTFSEFINSSTVFLQGAITKIPYEFEDLKEEIEDFLGFCQTVQLTEKATAMVKSFREEWGKQQTIFGNNPTRAMTLIALNKLKRELPKTVPLIIKDRILAIHEIIDPFSGKLLDQDAINYLAIIGQLLQQIDVNYNTFKRELGLLDFRDQLLLVRNLLISQPDILRQIRREIRYLLVDEFQDTNSLQLEIVDLLVGADHTAGRLMAVGDIKQSIYRFRGAEAELIAGLAQRLQNNHGKIIPLSQNYRSNQSIVRFVNEFFTELFTGELFNYEPLEAVLEDQDANIEFILTGNLDRQAEAQMIAARIKQLVAEGHNRFCYGDIVILFRASTSMHLYQQALQNLGIPYYTASGGGFYHCPEVVDQLNLLYLVEQRYNGVALLRLLTSPYVSLSAESLLWLGEGRDLVEQFYKESFSEHISPAEQLRLKRFRELLVFLQQNREYLGIPAIIRTALQGSNYRDILWSLPHASQRLANLDKLLEKADEFTNKGFYDLHRFLEYIEKLEEVAIVEGEAQTQTEGSNTVRLMTIHRAKGLEFPIVIIPDLDRQFPGSTKGKLSFHKSAGIGLKIRFSDLESGPSSLWKRIKELDKKEELAELRRVLYVALTRAKQQLILVGSGCNRCKGESIESANNWMKWFELLIPLDKAVSNLNFRGIELKITRTLPVMEAAPPSINLLAENIGLLPGSFEMNPESETEIAVTSLLKKTLTKTYKVTEILAFKECARRYFWEFQCGLKGSLAASYQQATERQSSNGNLGTKVGSFFHQILQLSGPEWPETLWQETFQNLPADNAERIKTDLIQMWQNFRQSQFTGDNGKFWDEIPFLVKVDEQRRIEGRFDRLIQQKNGVLILVDYKTHRINKSEVITKGRPYFWQLQIYALAIKNIWKQLPNQALLYFLYPNEILSVPLDEVSMADTWKNVRAAMQFIEEHHNWQEYPPGNGCPNCDYFGFCGQIVPEISNY